MNGLPISPMKTTKNDPYPLVGNEVVKTPLPCKSDLSDWLDLMETVEALCPKWPARPAEKYIEFRL